MAEHERDGRISAAYRGLGREAPPPELDAAILAEARRRRSRWTVPVSIAAVVVLAAGVTLRVQMEERPLPEQVVLEPKVMDAPAVADKSARAAKRAVAPLAAREEPAKDEMQAMRAPSAPASQVAGAAAPPAANIAVGKIAAAPETPEQWLERIAKLRAAGKAREADESLAEFRRRYPDYRIPEAMRKRVAPR
jgi:hypothetical protein